MGKKIKLVGFLPLHLISCISVGEGYSPVLCLQVSVNFWSALCIPLPEVVSLIFKGLLATSVRAG